MTTSRTHTIQAGERIFGRLIDITCWRTEPYTFSRRRRFEALSWIATRYEMILYFKWEKNFCLCISLRRDKITHLVRYPLPWNMIRVVTGNPGLRATSYCTRTQSSRNCRRLVRPAVGWMNRKKSSCAAASSTEALHHVKRTAPALCHIPSCYRLTSHRAILIFPFLAFNQLTCVVCLEQENRAGFWNTTIMTNNRRLSWYIQSITMFSFSFSFACLGYHNKSRQSWARWPESRMEAVSDSWLVVWLVNRRFFFITRVY